MVRFGIAIGIGIGIELRMIAIATPIKTLRITCVSAVVFAQNCRYGII